MQLCNNSYHKLKAQWRMLLQLQKHLQTELRSFQVWSHVTQKLGQISKICSYKSYILFRSFRISGHLPAHIKNARGDRFWKLRKIEEFLTLKVSWPWPWPWIGSYGIPSCITHRPLLTHQISSESEKLFVDGRTYIWSMLLRLLFGVDLIVIIMNRGWQ